MWIFEEIAQNDEIHWILKYDFKFIVEEEYIALPTKLYLYLWMDKIMEFFFHVKIQTNWFEASFKYNSHFHIISVDISRRYNLTNEEPLKWERINIWIEFYSIVDQYLE